MTKIKKGSIVEFNPLLGTEIYPSIIPEIGEKGTVKQITFNIGLMQLMGVHLPMAQVQFKQDIIFIYLEDLKWIRDEFPSEEIDLPSTDHNIN